MLISHTVLDTRLGKDEFMAKMMRPKLISKEQAKIVADAGGVIGIWTRLAGSALEYAQNIRALVDLIGINHVCIGTNTKLTPSFQPSGNFGTKPGAPLQAGSDTPGNRPKDNKSNMNAPLGGNNQGRQIRV